MKKITNKFVKILMLISMIFSSFQTPIQVFAQEIANNDSDIPVGAIKLGENGNIVEGNTVSKTVTENGISVTKTVSKTDTLGKYHVKFEVKGTKTEVNRPVYVVVVFDRSGSMAEDKYGYSDYEKWNGAKKAAQDFANTLLANIPTAKLGLVVFSGRAKITREFESKNFASTVDRYGNDSLFEYADGGTNIHAGLLKAKELFNKAEKNGDLEENALKYVVLLSDGEPTFYNSTCYDLFGNEYACISGEGDETDRGTLEATLKVADTIKEMATLYSIGYELVSGTAYNGTYTYNGVDYTEKLTTEEILTKIATSATESDSYYFSASDKDEIVTAFDEIASGIVKAGTNAQVIDKLGGQFKLVTDNNNNYGAIVSSQVFEDFSDETQVFEFDIEINPDASTGWHQTNDGFKLKYIDNNGVEQIIDNDEDPYVYWKQKTYQYKVNYYKDSFENKPFKTDTREAVNGTVIDIYNVEKDKYLTEAGVGYEFNSIDPVSITITNDGSIKEINVLYTLKKFSYMVNYYKDGIALFTIDEDNISYGTKVNPVDYYLDLTDTSILNRYKLEGYRLDSVNTDKNIITIDSNDKAINIYYVKDNFNFTVDYWFDGIKNNNLSKNGNAEYGTDIKAEDYHLSSEVLNDKGYDDYFLDPDMNAFNYEEKTIGVNSEDNKLNIYYIKTDIPVNGESITKTTTNGVITASNTIVKYNVIYTAKVNNVRTTDKVIVKIVDTLPAKIDVNNNGTNLNGGVYNSDNNTITWTKELTVEEFTREYNVNETISYQVVYMDYAKMSASVNNKLVNTAHGMVEAANKKSTGVEDNAEVEVNIQGNLIVKHVDEAGNDLINPTETTKAVGTGYNETKKDIYGYTFKSDSGNTQGEYIEGTTTVVFTYSKNDGTVTENEVVKTGQENVNSIDGVFNYTLSYKGEIKDYVGKAKLTLVDKLPYELEDGSTYEGCTYNAQDKTLTCVKEFDIKENNTKVEASFNLSLIFKNIDSNKITNKVESKLEYGNNHSEDEDDTETEIFKGTVIARYFDEDENVIAPEESSTGLGGSEYTTSKKDIYGYTFKEVIGEENGKYAAKETICVDYIYTKNDGTVTENVTTKDQINTILGSNSEFEYVLSYNGKIEDYKGDAIITLTDKLPYTVKEIKYDENACSFNKDTNTLICTKIVKIDEENQEVNVEFRVVVKYLGLTSESDLTVKNKVDAILTYGDNKKTSDGETEDVVKSSKVVAIYVDEDDNELASSEEMTGLIDNEYTTEEKDILGYTLKEVPSNKDGLYTEEEIIVKYVYTKNIGTSEEEVKKVGLEEVASINDAFIYTITYNAVVKDYVGDVKLVITDKLPYEIDEEKSVIDTNNDNITCKYIDSKIVCEYNKTIDSEEDNTIDVVINLELYFKNVNSDMVVNKVEAELTYGDIHKISKDETGTKVLSGTVIVNYITEDGEELALSEEMTGLVGEDYKTTKKAFDKYYLKEVKGNETGVYAEDTQEVTYVYSLIPLPPQTGYEGNNTNYIGLFILGIVMLLFKKKI